MVKGISLIVTAIIIAAIGLDSPDTWMKVAVWILSLVMMFNGVGAILDSRKHSGNGTYKP